MQPASLYSLNHRLYYCLGFFVTRLGGKTGFWELEREKQQTAHIDLDWRRHVLFIDTTFWICFTITFMSISVPSASLDIPSLVPTPRMSTSAKLVITSAPPLRYAARPETHSHAQLGSFAAPRRPRMLAVAAVACP